MAFGFPARFAESRKFHLQRNELFAVVKSAFENLGWLGYTIGQNDEFYKKLRSSPLTWGEDFWVNVLPDGTIEAESRCAIGGYRRMPQIFDFGVNRQNVETFFNQVELEIEERRM
jgi:hypothetical protein